MGHINPGAPPVHGRVITGAWLDTLFGAFKTVLEGQIDRTNLRASAGLRNTSKTHPRSWVPMVWSLPSLAVDATKTFTGLLALPSYDGGRITAANSLRSAARLVSMQAGHGGLTGFVGGDKVEATLWLRDYPYATLWDDTPLDFTASAHALATTGALNYLVDYFHLSLTVTVAGAGRVVQNPRVIVWTQPTHSA